MCAFRCKKVRQGYHSIIVTVNSTTRKYKTVETSGERENISSQ
jgi:hypothetical protein